MKVQRKQVGNLKVCSLLDLLQRTILLQRQQLQDPRVQRKQVGILERVHSTRFTTSIRFTTAIRCTKATRFTTAAAVTESTSATEKDRHKLILMSDFAYCSCSWPLQMWC